MEYFFVGLLLIFSGGIITLFFSSKFKGIILTIFLITGTIFISLSAIPVILTGNIINYNILLTFPIGETQIVIDPLSAFFVLLISIMSIFGVVYSIFYLKPYISQKSNLTSHYFFLSLLIVSMLLVCVMQNIITFLIVWEIMSLSSFFLVVFESEKKEVIDAGINYLITMHIGVIFLITGFILLANQSGNLNFESFKNILNKDKFFTDFIFIIFFIGFGIKAGFFPLHSWLPKAHPASPSHVSGMMSGIMIKTGIYGILRIIYIMKIPGFELSIFVIIISLITALYGIIYSLVQDDFKKLLAYSSIENIGIIGLGIGFGMLGLSLNNNPIAILGFSGAFLHIINHSIFKGILFYGTGTVYQMTHIKNMEKLGGLIKYMPYTGFFVLLGSIAICGLPPFNGFISEFIIYFAFINGIKTSNLFLIIISILSIGGLALIGGIAIITFTKLFSIIFLGSARTDVNIKKENFSPAKIIPLGILVLFMFLIGIFPAIFINFISKTVLFFGLQNILLTDEFSAIINISNSIGLISFIFIILFTIIFILRYFLLHKKSVKYYKTWDCGYQAGTPKIQYTGSSFINPFVNLINPIIKNEKKIKKPAGIFPENANLEINNFDIIDYFIINPINKLIEKFLKLFLWIQNGSTQQYILYGLLFLVIAILVVIGVNK